jgi:hypothetical protein
LNKYKKDLHIGSLDTKKAAAPVAAPKAVEAPKPAPAKATPAEKKQEKDNEPLELAGSLIPFGDPSWYQGVSSTLPRIPQSFKTQGKNGRIVLTWNSTSPRTITRPTSRLEMRSALGLRRRLSRV